MPSFTSTLQTVTSNGTVSYSTVSPFLVPREIVNQAGTATTIYSEDMYSVDHSHTGYINDLHSDQATRSVPQNDGYPLDQEGLYYDNDSSGVSATIYSRLDPRCAHQQRHAASQAEGRDRDGSRGLRHDPIPVAVCRPLHDVRQHAPDRDRTFDPERDRDDRCTDR